MTTTSTVRAIRFAWWHPGRTCRFFIGGEVSIHDIWVEEVQALVDDLTFASCEKGYRRPKASVGRFPNDTSWLQNHHPSRPGKTLIAFTDATEDENGQGTLCWDIAYGGVSIPISTEEAEEFVRKWEQFILTCPLPDWGNLNGPRLPNLLDELLQRSEIRDLRDQCLEFFIAASEGKTYVRTPSLALRLPHDDFIFVIKPTTTHRGKSVKVDGRGVLIECLRRLDDRKSTKQLVVLATDEVKKLSWMRDESLSLKAATALVEMAELFAVDPYRVIEKNTDNCCCCGKGLTDEVSRGRGIGPECMARIGIVFGRATVGSRDFDVNRN